jgi:NAD(P)-dependent dehydrogenase (short-subunit alcohol dehydrogenase family)
VGTTAPDKVRHFSWIGGKMIILVTGGARGIGAATARLAAQRGYDVCVAYRSRTGTAEEVVADCEKSGTRAIAVRADVSREPDVVALFDTVESQLGPLDALVNNAGAIGRQGRLQDLDVERIRGVLAVNLLGTILCAREAVRRMLPRNTGAIVNVSSRAAVLGGAREYVDYAAAKAGVDALTVGLAAEVAPDGIRVNGVRPGLIYTELHATGGEPGRVDRLKDSVPMRRGGNPEEVARAILWLLSPEASYVTGTTLDVSGGR